MQIDRLFQIVQILLHKNKVTADDLAERFMVSRRTIYRDLDTLSLNGVPVITERGKGGGISLMDNYTLDRSTLTEAERNQLLLGLETLKATQAADVDQVLGKFRDLFRSSQQDWIRVDFSHWGNDPNEKKKFEDIKFALATHRVITFHYFDARQHKTERKVNPIQLLFKEKAWYLIGYCHTRQDFRFFKLIRMVHLDLTQATFDPTDYPLTSDLLYEAPALEGGQVFRFLLSKDLRYRVYDEFTSDQITPLPSGDFLLTYYGQEDAWLYNFILSYGEHLKVLEPIELKVTIHDKIKKMLALYEGEDDPIDLT